MRIAVHSLLLVTLACACGVAEEATLATYTGQPAGGGSAPGLQDPPPPPDDPSLSDPPPADPEQPGEEATGFEECATQYDAAKLKPLDMVVMLDRSGSMADGGKWGAVTTALQQFAANPESEGIGVALSYFPETYSDVCLPCDFGCGVCFNGCCALPTGQLCWSDGDCNKGGVCHGFMCHAGGGNATCKVGDYADPEVALAALPAAAGLLNVSLAKTSPAGGTPTGPALQGALSYASSLAAKPDANEVVVVLATDGEPTECQPQQVGDVAAIAAAAAASPQPIATFVIGVGSNLFNLNAIAAAGGTGQAYLVDANANATQSFLDTLNAIREVAVACQYEIPTVDGMISYDLVNVAYSTQSGPLTPVGNVANAAACGIGGGWYYDDPNAPKSIVMCPSTCEQLHASADTQIEIVYGCETILK